MSACGKSTQTLDTLIPQYNLSYYVIRPAASAFTKDVTFCQPRSYSVPILFFLQRAQVQRNSRF